MCSLRLNSTRIGEDTTEEEEAMTGLGEGVRKRDEAYLCDTIMID